jgi:hypothetical protein
MIFAKIIGYIFIIVLGVFFLTIITWLLVEALIAVLRRI